MDESIALVEFSKRGGTPRVEAVAYAHSEVGSKTRSQATYAAYLASCGAGAGALDVVARPKHAHVYDDALVARYLTLEDDVRAGRL